MGCFPARRLSRYQPARGQARASRAQPAESSRQIDYGVGVSEMLERSTLNSEISRAFRAAPGQRTTACLNWTLSAERLPLNLLIAYAFSHIQKH